MPDEKDLLLALFQHNSEQARHHQIQRATTTNLIIVISSGIIGLIALDHQLNHADFYPALLLVVLGVFGALWSAKHHERFAYYTERARGYRDESDSLLPGAKLKTIKEAADEETKKKHKFLHKIQLWHLWVFLHIVIAVIGGWIASRTR